MKKSYCSYVSVAVGTLLWALGNACCTFVPAHGQEVAQNGQICVDYTTLLDISYCPVPDNKTCFGTHAYYTLATSKCYDPGVVTNKDCHNDNLPVSKTLYSGYCYYDPIHKTCESHPQYVGSTVSDLSYPTCNVAAI